MEQTVSAVPALAGLQHLDLRTTDFSDDGFARIAAFPDLQRVEVHGSHLTARGVRHLRALSKPKHLALCRDHLTDSALAELRGLQLESLDLLDNPEISDAAMPDVARMHDLRYLRLQGTSVGDGGIEALRQLPHLTFLSIGQTKVTEAGLAIVPEFKSLKTLEACGLPVTARRIGEIAELPELTVLCLGGEFAFLHSDLKPLEKLKTLEWLNLSFSNVEDDWLASLARLTQVKHLDLSATHVTTEGLRTLHESLPGCTIFSDHGTFEPEPSDGLSPGERDRQVAEWIIDHGGLVSFREDATDKNSYYVGSREGLSKSLTVTGIAAFRNPPAPVSEAEFLAQLRRLRGGVTWLELSNLFQGGEGISALLTIPAFQVLEHLTVQDVRVRDEDLTGLAAFPKLQILHLIKARVTDRGVRNLRLAVPQLTNLMLQDCEVTDSGVAELAGLKLFRLDLQI